MAGRVLVLVTIVALIWSASASAGTIHGHVFDGATTTSGIDRVCVSADGPGGHSGFAFTDASGAYAITGLGADDYTVAFQPCADGDDHVMQWYDGAPNPTQATPVPVTAAGTATANAHLARGGSIAGHVIDPDGNPLAGICVSTGGTIATLTDADGAYVLHGFPPGAFGLELSNACGGGNWAFVQNLAVNVTAGQTSTQDVTMHPGGVIRGHVTGSGNALAGICVDVGRQSAQTDADGDYVVDGLASGTYAVTVRPCGKENWLTQTSDRHQVTAGGAEVVVDADLQPGATFSGRVTGAGAPLAGVCVVLDDGNPLAIVPVSAQTDADGGYTVAGAPPGTYRLGFFACDAGNWARRWLDPVTVTTGQSVPADVELAPGASISGRVTDGAGHPLAGICVSASTDAVHSDGFAMTAPDGSYTLIGLSARAYDVVFTDACDLSRPSAFTDGSAPVTLTGGEQRTGVNVVLKLVGDSGPPPPSADIPTPFMPVPMPGALPSPAPRIQPPVARSSAVPCVVPKVAEKTLAQARRLLTGAHCAAGKVRRKASRKVKRGRVLKQAMRAGTTLPGGTAVALTLSKGIRAR